MEKEAKVKSTAGTLLAKLRWAKATPAERAAVGKMLAASRKRAKKLRKSKGEK